MRGLKKFKEFFGKTCYLAVVPGPYASCKDLRLRVTMKEKPKPLVSPCELLEYQSVRIRPKFPTYGNAPITENTWEINRIIREHLNLLPSFNN